MAARGCNRRADCTDAGIAARNSGPAEATLNGAPDVAKRTHGLRGRAHREKPDRGEYRRAGAVEAQHRCRTTTTRSSSMQRVARRSPTPEAKDLDAHLNPPGAAARIVGPALHQCRAHSPYQVQCSCRYCQPSHSPRPFTSGTSITGTATASCPAIISRPTTTFQFIVRGGQSATLQTMRQATGTMARGTISAGLDFSVDATTAAVSARAGVGRPSGRCGIAGRSQQKVRITDGLTSHSDRPQRQMTIRL